VDAEPRGGLLDRQHLIEGGGGLALHPGFSVLVGLPLYGTLGLVVGALYSRWRKPRVFQL
jgi:hypothetical protein